jgi:hypothetical protein
MDKLIEKHEEITKEIGKTKKKLGELENERNSKIIKPRVIHINENKSIKEENVKSFTYGLMSIMEVKSILIRLGQNGDKINQNLNNLNEGDILDILGEDCKGYLFVCRTDRGLRLYKTENNYLPYPAIWFFQKCGVKTSKEIEEWWPGIIGINDGKWEKDGRMCKFIDNYINFPLDINSERRKFSFE